MGWLDREERRERDMGALGYTTCFDRGSHPWGAGHSGSSHLGLYWDLKGQKAAT